MRSLGMLVAVIALAAPLHAQNMGSLSGLMSDLVEPHDYALKRVSSYDRSGGNDDSRKIAVGETLTVLEESGPEPAGAGPLL